MRGWHRSSAERQVLHEKVVALLASDRYHKATLAVRTYRCSVHPDDLVGEFNRGIARALHSVKMDIGDPMEYLISRGFRHVQTIVSQTLNEGVIEECLVCGKSRPYRRNPCYTCGNRNFILHPRFISLLQKDDGSLVIESNNRRTKPDLGGAEASSNGRRSK